MDGGKSRDSLRGRGFSCRPPFDDDPPGVEENPIANVACLSSFRDAGLPAAPTLVGVAILVGAASLRSLSADGAVFSVFCARGVLSPAADEVVGSPPNSFLSCGRGLGGRITDSAMRWMYMCRC